MPLSSGTVALTQFSADFDKLTMQEVEDALTDEAFTLPDGSLWHLACGWLPWGEIHTDTDFTRRDRWHFAPYLGFQFRVDTKKVNGPLLRMRTGEAVTAWCKEMGRARCPAAVRKELKGAIEEDLLRSTQPTPSTYDVIVNTVTGHVFLGTQKASVVELFRKQWKVTFQSVPLLVMGFQAESPIEAPSQMDSGEFLLWLWWRAETAPEFSTADGPFQVYINDRVKLEHPRTLAQTLLSGEGTGQQPEGMAALGSGKVPTELSIQLEHDGSVYTFTLRGSPLELYQAKLPPTDKEGWAGRLYDRVFLLEKLQALVQVLINDFRGVYIEGWSKTALLIREWIEKEDSEAA